MAISGSVSGIAPCQMPGTLRSVAIFRSRPGIEPIELTGLDKIVVLELDLTFKSELQSVSLASVKHRTSPMRTHQSSSSCYAGADKHVSVVQYLETDTTQADSIYNIELLTYSYRPL